MGEGTFPSVASAYGVSVTVQDLEFTLGEGPATDAYAEGKPVLVDDVALVQQSLAAVRPGHRRLRDPQPVRAPSAAGGDQARRARPLPRRARRCLEGEELSAALLVADLVTNQVLDMQAGAVVGILGLGARGRRLPGGRPPGHGDDLGAARLCHRRSPGAVAGPCLCHRAAHRPGGGRGRDRRAEVRRAVTVAKRQKGRTDGVF